MRLRLIIAYDGRAYSGWQSQASANTIQDILEKTFQKIAGRRIAVHGAGRTDAGVHALGQCAHADVFATMSPARMAARAKRELAADHSRDEVISCRFQLPCTLLSESKSLPICHPPWAHSPTARIRSRLARATSPPDRRSAAGLSAPGRSARLRRFLCAARQALRATRIRTIQKVGLAHRGELLTLSFQGDGFLYKMVRMLTAAIVRVAQGRDTLESLQSRLETGVPKSNHVAPPDGLTLMRVLY